MSPVPHVDRAEPDAAQRTLPSCVSQKKRPARVARGQSRRTKRKLSCFPPLLDCLQLLAVFLRIAHNLALRQAVDPQVARNITALTASADGSAVAKIRGPLFGRILRPAA